MSLRGMKCRSNPLIKMILYHNKVETCIDTVPSAYIVYHAKAIDTRFSKETFIHKFILAKPKKHLILMSRLHKFHHSFCFAVWMVLGSLSLSNTVYHYAITILQLIFLTFMEEIQ